MDSTTTVTLQCVRQGSKLRVRILSPGYNRQANCQFPRAIRAENRLYEVPQHAITFSEGPRQKFFYRVKASCIKIVDQQGSSTSSSAAPAVTTTVHLAAVYGDTDEDEDCAVCMSAIKDAVFAPCGHYDCCERCALTIFNGTRKCPICRARIGEVVHRSRIE